MSMSTTCCASTSRCSEPPEWASRARWFSCCRKSCGFAANPQDFLQHEHHRARLAHSGGSEHREVLAQHVVDIDIGADGAVLLEMSNFDYRGAGDIEHQPQFA